MGEHLRTIRQFQNWRSRLLWEMRRTEKKRSVRSRQFAELVHTYYTLLSIENKLRDLDTELNEE